MNRFRISAIFISLALFLPITTSAETIPTISMTDSCTVTDTDGESHSFSGQYLGICALAAAKDQGAVSSYTLQNFSFGLFLQSLNGTTPGETQFWSISQNGTEALVGLSDMTLASGDLLSFQLTDWTDNSTVGAPVQFRIGTLTSSASRAGANSSSSGGGDYLKGREFNTSAALEFLSSNQNADGSYASALLTDWAAIAFGSANDPVCNEACGAARQKLRMYLFGAEPALSSVTDYERHAMALIALGINPYSETNTDYVTPIVSAFDGTQIGNSSLVNDDIFAVFPLLHSGYSKTNAMMEAIVSFILSKQKVNGSWEGSVDLTAAALQALAPFGEQVGVTQAVKKAEEFLRRNQNESGIFGSNSFSLSWVLQAIHALGQTPVDWSKSGLTPLGYLGVLQQEDGGVEPLSAGKDARVWATSYAVPAALARSWDDILGYFTRPVSVEPAATSTDVRVPMTVSVVSAPPVVESMLEAATTSATTSPNVAAAVVADEQDRGALFWLSGLFLILGATFYFLRRA